MSPVAGDSAVASAQSPKSWSLGGLETVAACPACGSNQRSAAPLRIRDHLGTNAPEQWELWRCSSCASIFLDPRPDEASIAATYGSYYTHELPQSSHGAGCAGRVLWPYFRGYLHRQFGWREAPFNRFGYVVCNAIVPLKLKLDYLARHLFVADFPSRGILLDIGCGNGEFLASASRMGWTINGVDPDPKAIAACKAQGFDAVFRSLSDLPREIAGKIDVITSSNCIEHVSDPRGFLKSAFQLLKPGGRVWLSTPNPQGLGIRIFGRYWRGLEPSRHLCVPSQQQLVRMLAEAGYDNIRILRRGSHGKTIVRESVTVAKMEAKSGARIPFWFPWLAWPLRAFASTLGAVVPGLGEETVVVADRGSKASNEGSAA